MTTTSKIALCCHAAVENFGAQAESVLRYITVEAGSKLGAPGSDMRFFLRDGEQYIRPMSSPSIEYDESRSTFVAVVTTPSNDDFKSAAKFLHLDSRLNVTYIVDLPLATWALLAEPSVAVVQHKVVCSITGAMPARNEFSLGEGDLVPKLDDPIGDMLHERRPDLKTEDCKMSFCREETENTGTHWKTSQIDSSTPGLLKREEAHGFMMAGGMMRGFSSVRRRRHLSMLTYKTLPNVYAIERHTVRVTDPNDMMQVFDRSHHVAVSIMSLGDFTRSESDSNYKWSTFELEGWSSQMTSLNGCCAAIVQSSDSSVAPRMHLFAFDAADGWYSQKRDSPLHHFWIPLRSSSAPSGAGMIDVTPGETTVQVRDLEVVAQGLNYWNASAIQCGNVLVVFYTTGKDEINATWAEVKPDASLGSWTTTVIGKGYGTSACLVPAGF